MRQADCLRVLNFRLTIVLDRLAVKLKVDSTGFGEKHKHQLPPTAAQAIHHLLKHWEYRSLRREMKVRVRKTRIFSVANALAGGDPYRDKRRQQSPIMGAIVDNGIVNISIENEITASSTN